MAIFGTKLACVAGACKEQAQEKTGAREGDTRDIFLAYIV